MQYPSLEIHVPISPNNQFLRMAQYLLYSLRRNGGRYADCKFVLTIGEGHVTEDIEKLHPWMTKQGVEVRWVPLPLFSELSYYATAHHRLTYEYTSDMVLLMDADMLFLRPIDDLVARIWREQKFTGLIPHVCPFDTLDLWQKLYDEFELGTAQAVHQLTGWPYMITDPSKRFTPPYFNYGFILMPASFATQIGDIVFDVLRRSTKIVDNIYKCQFSLALSLVKLGLPYELLQMRYNFANNMYIEALHGAELPHAAILHLLADHQGVFKTFYGSDEGLEAFLAREDLAGVNALAQEVMRSVHHDALRDWHGDAKKQGALSRLFKGK